MNRSERITQALMTAKSVGGKLELNRAKEAKKRAHGQIFPSKYMPGVPRQVRADGGRLNDEQKSENLKKWAHNIHPLLQDEHGMPKKLYHGTASDIHSFRPSGTGEFGPGIYMTDLPDEAGGYAGTHAGGQNIMPVYAVMRNPFVVKNDPQEFWEKFGGGSDEDAMYNAMAAGHDGVIFRRPYTIWDDKGRRFIPTGQYHTHYIAFSPNQVKSASGNIGTFDPREKDIAKKDGGPLKLFHGTEHPDPIEQLDPFISPDQLGVHLGDAPTANRFAKRMNYDPRTNATRAPRVIPVHAHIKNPLRLEDNWGTWEPSIVHQQLVKKGLMHQDHDLNERLMNLEQGMTEEGEDPHNERKAKQLQNHAIKFMHGLINQLGYDGIVYLNRFEMPTDEAKARLENHPLPRGKLNSMTDEEFKDEFPEAVDSYIALDPKQIKSPFGEGSGVGYADGGFTMPKIKPSSDDIHEVGSANFDHYDVAGHKMLPIATLTGGVDLNDPKQRARVDALKAKMQHPESGYISRLVVDDAGNVVEGQHRLDALRELGATHVPATVIRDKARNIDLQGLRDAIRKAGTIHPDHVNQIAGMAIDSVADSGSAAKARDEWGAPQGFEPHWSAALDEIERQQSGNPVAKANGGEVNEWHDAHHYADGGDVEQVPERTIKAYKLFRTKKSSPGKLFPLFVHANDSVPIGEWVDAKVGPPGKNPEKVKSSLGDLAYRPGWHAGDLPIATHIGGRSHKDMKRPPDYRPADQVWAEVEMPADVDWQSVANSRMQMTKDGRPIASTAHITDQVPVGGHYRYKTNPNMTGNWIIGGSMKVNRVLSDDEVKDINDQAGVADLPRHPDYPAKALGGEVENDILKKCAKGGFIGGENVDKLIKKAMLTARKAGSCHE